MKQNENFMPLFEDALNEDLNFINRRRWRLAMASLNFVDTDSYRKAFPEETNLSDKEIIKKLKDKLRAFSDKKKEELASARVLIIADLKLKGYDFESREKFIYGHKGPGLSQSFSDEAPKFIVLAGSAAIAAIGLGDNADKKITMKSEEQISDMLKKEGA